MAWIGVSSMRLVRVYWSRRSVTRPEIPAGNIRWVPTGNSAEDTEHADLILVWGGNIVSTNMHQVVLAEKARKKGAQIVVIDVHRNRTAQWGDWFIPLYPGTAAHWRWDLMHVLFEQGLTDEAFMQKYTVGHEALRDHVRSYTLDRVARISGVPEEPVVKLAELYGNAKAAHIMRIGNGLQHHDNGGMNVRSVHVPGYRALAEARRRCCSYQQLCEHE